MRFLFSLLLAGLFSVGMLWVAVGCSDPPKPLPPTTPTSDEPVPPGATNFVRLNDRYYTYEFEGSKILVHRCYAYNTNMITDSIVISR